MENHENKKHKLNGHANHFSLLRKEKTKHNTEQTKKHSNSINKKNKFTFYHINVITEDDTSGPQLPKISLVMKKMHTRHQNR